MNKVVIASREARKLRVEHNLMERPIDVFKLCKKIGIDLFEQTFSEDSDISAILVKKGADAAIEINQNHSKTRQRFSVAHEIGHWRLHADNDKLDIAKGSLDLKVFMRSENRSPDEIEANEFAAELLMPEDLIQKEFYHLVESGEENFISELAKRYKVSESAIAFRLKKLNLFTSAF